MTSPTPPTRPPPLPLPKTPSVPKSYIAMAVTFFVVPNVVLLITMAAESRLGPWIWMGHSVLLGGAYMASSYIFGADQRRLRALLVENQRRVCPRCRYPLASLPPTAQTDRCPECGTSNDPEAIARIWAEWEAKEDKDENEKKAKKEKKEIEKSRQ